MKIFEYLDSVKIDSIEFWDGYGDLHLYNVNLKNLLQVFDHQFYKIENISKIDLEIFGEISSRRFYQLVIEL